MKGEGDRSIFKHRPFLSMSWAEDLNTGTMARTIALYVHCSGVEPLQAVEWHLCHLPAAPASWTVPSRLDFVVPPDQTIQDERVRLMLRKSPSL